MMKRVSQRRSKQRGNKNISSHVLFSQLYYGKTGHSKSCVIKLTFLATDFDQEKIQYGGECQLHQHASGPLLVCYCITQKGGD